MEFIPSEAYPARLGRARPSASKRAAIAAEILPRFQDEARKRQAEAGPHEGRGRKERPLGEKIPEAVQGRASERAGKLLHVNRRYVEQAAELKEKDPELRGSRPARLPF